MQLLRLLSDGKFHSGEELGSRLGVSRTAVWKQLSAWRKRGISLEVVAGKGYRLQSPIEWWSREALLAGLGKDARSSLHLLDIRERTTSTNDTALALLREQGGPGVVCLAEEQSAGRGRRGREWLSPLGANFYGSVGWLFPQGISAVEGLSLAAGVAVARALRRYGMEGVGLKWPNDIMVGDAKLGGILIELQAEADGPCMVVLGVGINLRLPAGAAEHLGRPVTDVAAHVPAPLQRNRLGGLLVDELLCLLRHYPERGFATLLEEWSELDTLRGAPVCVTGLETDIEGIARGVDPHGALRLETEQGIRLLHGGEVSLRKRPA